MKPVISRPSHLRSDPHALVIVPRDLSHQRSPRYSTSSDISGIKFVVGVRVLRALTSTRSFQIHAESSSESGERKQTVRHIPENQVVVGRTV